jgi:protein translocase SecG subunit
MGDKEIGIEISLFQSLYLPALTLPLLRATLGLLNIRMQELILPIIQMVLSALLVAAILLQQRGSGLGAAFGGGSDVFRTKRGVEKLLHYATIGIAVLFFGNALLTVLLV